jgi:protein-glutamine gamma-glutamyltransferase
MTTAEGLRVATYLLVAEGLAALYLGGLLGPLGLALVSAGVVASWWQEALRAPLANVRGGQTLPAVIAISASALDLVYLAESVLDGLVHLLLLLLLYRLFTRSTLRDVRDIGFVCFFMLVAAAPGTFDVAFLGVFVGFLLVGIWMLLARHLLVESPAEPGLVARTGVVHARHVVGLSLSAAAATLVATAVLFVVIPRIGQAALPLRARVGRMVSGFSDRVSLGAFGEIETDAAVVMRVHVRAGRVSPEAIPNLRWRGIALDHFDGRVWTRHDATRSILRRARSGSFEVARHRGGGLMVTQEIYLEPIGTDVIFGAPDVLGVSVRSDIVMVDDAGSVMVPGALARLEYVVHSEVDPMPGRRATSRPPEPLDDEDRARYLELPPLEPRVWALAREIVGQGSDPAERARRLTAHLSARYRYTRALERRTVLSPVEEFLFVTRAGNCEYFAASLAVMLRSLGIPARVVNGFQRGEWNPYGGYFMVRLLDAHSWVEAYLDGAGWVTLDPSPRAGSEADTARAPMSLYLDALRMRWYRYVVNWSLHDQMHAAFKVRHAASTWPPSLDWLRRPISLGPAALLLAGAVLIAGALAVARWRAAWALAHARMRAMPRFYARALRALGRRGWRPEPGETAREFSARVMAAIPAWADPLAELTLAYERARFGDAPPTREELERLRAAVARLRSGRNRLWGGRNRLWGSR